MDAISLLDALKAAGLPALVIDENTTPESLDKMIHEAGLCPCQDGGEPLPARDAGQQEMLNSMRKKRKDVEDNIDKNLEVREALLHMESLMTEALPENMDEKAQTKWRLNNKMEQTACLLTLLQLVSSR